MKVTWPPQCPQQAKGSSSFKQQCLRPSASHGQINTPTPPVLGRWNSWLVWSFDVFFNCGNLTRAAVLGFWHFFTVPPTEPRWCPPDLGAAFRDVREDNWILGVPGHPEQPDGWSQGLHTSPVSLHACVLRAQPLLPGAVVQPLQCPHWLHHQAGHHLPHCCPQWERLRSRHPSPMAARWAHLLTSQLIIFLNNGQFNTFQFVHSFVLMFLYMCRIWQRRHICKTCPQKTRHLPWYVSSLCVKCQTWIWQRLAIMNNQWKTCCGFCLLSAVRLLVQRKQGRTSEVAQSPPSQFLVPFPLAVLLPGRLTPPPLHPHPNLILHPQVWLRSCQQWRQNNSMKPRRKSIWDVFFI